MDKKKLTKKEAADLHERKRHIAELHERLITSIFKKIPELRGANEIGLSMVHFKKLTDEEFVTLWALPQLVIKVSDKAAKYLEERRRLLGLKRTTHSGVIQGENKAP